MRDSLAGVNERSQFGNDVRQCHLTSTFPTDNLTEETGQQVLTLLIELTADAGTTLVLAAGYPPLADRMRRIHEGKLMVTAQLMRSVKELIS